MKLKILSKLKQNKIYKDTSFTSIVKKDSKEIMKNDCFILLTHNINETSKLINKGIGCRNYYKNIYVHRIITTTNKASKKTINITEYYKDLNGKLDVNLIGRKKLSDLQRKNVYVDLSTSIEFFQETLITKKGIKVLDKFITQLSYYIKSVNTYRNICMVVPINLTNVNISDYNMASKIEKNISQYFFHMFKKPEYISKFLDNLKELKISKKNLSLLFLNPENGIFFYVNLDDNNVKNKIYQKSLTNLRRLIKAIANPEEEKNLIHEVSKNEADEEVDNINLSKSKKAINDKTQEFISNKGNEIVDSFLKSLNLKNPSNSQINLIDKLSDRVIELLQDTDENTSNKSILDMLENDESFKEYLEELKNSQTIGMSNKELKTLASLSEKQEETLKKNKSIKEILQKNEDITIKKEEIKVNNTIFDNIKTNNVKNFDNSYMENMYDKDLLNALKAFNDDKDLPLFIDSFEREDTSNDMTKKETLTIVYKDPKGVRHTVKVDMPKIIDGKYVYINGSKKLIQKQIILKPIVKIKPDSVQVTTNYNKLFIRRFGQKLSENLESMKKIFLDKDFSTFIREDKKFIIRLGDISSANQRYPINIYYQSLSEFMLRIEAEEFIIIFDYDLLVSMTEKESSLDYDSKLASFEFDKELYHIIGYTRDKKALLLVNKVNNVITICDDENILYDLKDKGKNLTFFLNGLLQSCMKDEYKDKINTLSRPKSLMFNRVKINSNEIPLAILLGYEYGLTNILDRYNINYIFSSTRKKPNIVSENTMVIKFNNGYLYYDSTLIRNSLLLSGLNVLHPDNYEFKDFEKNGIAYINYFDNTFGSRNTGKGLHNTLSLLVDPKTKDILERLDLPTDIFDILLYCNTLLENNQYNRSNNYSNYRIRGTEQVTGLLYKTIADSYKTYKDTSKNGNPIKVSLPQDIILKRLTELQTVDEASDLNPSLELEKASAVTFGGLSGLNSKDAYTDEMRSYDESMVGIVGAESPDSDRVGVIRYLTYNTNIVNTLGFLDTDKDKNNDNSTNMYTVAELLSPFTSTHSDPARQAFQTNQQRQILPVADPKKPLFGSGVEKTVPYLVSDVFTFKAKKDGIIKKIDEKTGTALLEYNDGTTDIINLNPTMIKNSSGGFYQKSMLSMLYNEGKKFKAQELLAADKSTMNIDNPNDVVYTFGYNASTAIASTSLTYEDSSFVSTKLSNHMMSKMTELVDLTFAPNTNIEYLRGIGENIKTGDPLVIFENSFEDEEINKILEKLGTDFGEAVSSLSKNTIRSKYTGKIVDFKIYYNVDLENFSDSIQKIIKTYSAKTKKIKEIIDKKALGDSMVKLNLPSPDKIEGDKIKSKRMEGLRIEYYIEFEDYVGVGDKIRFNSCKTIVSRVMDENEMAYSELNGPDNPLEAVISPQSLISRMTTDIYNHLYLGKEIKNLKKLMRKIAER